MDRSVTEEVRISCNRGRFRITDPNREEWLLELFTPFGRLQMFFDEEPFNCDGSVEFCLELLEARSKQYLYFSGADTFPGIVAKIRENLPYCELLLNRRLLAWNKKELQALTQRVAMLRRTVEALEEEVNGNNGST